MPFTRPAFQAWRNDPSPRRFWFSDSMVTLFCAGASPFSAPARLQTQRLEPDNQRPQRCLRIEARTAFITTGHSLNEIGTTPVERRAERRYQLQVKRDLPRNFMAHLGHGMLGQTGFRFINAPTFIPAYLLMLSGGSNVVVGLLSRLIRLPTMFCTVALSTKI